MADRKQPLCGSKTLVDVGKVAVKASGTIIERGSDPSRPEKKT
jgi:hypothetical protein